MLDKVFFSVFFFFFFLNFVLLGAHSNGKWQSKGGAIVPSAKDVSLRELTMGQ